MMTAPVPPGNYLIVSVQYPGVVADLAGGNPTGHIIGFPEHDGKNQQWELRHFGQSVYTFQSQFGTQSYACSIDTEVKGNTLPASYTLHRVEGTKDQYKIVDTSDHNKGWTLTSSKPSTNITLSPDNGQDNQRWKFTKVK